VLLLFPTSAGLRRKILHSIRISKYLSEALIHLKLGGASTLVCGL
jgi:hypothetical protein